MHAAALSGSTEVVFLLLEAGADPTLRNGGLEGVEMKDTSKFIKLEVNITLIG